MLPSLLLVASLAAADPPPEFALVPPDAAGVVHVRLAELWNHPALADYRALVGKAGPEAVAQLDAQFTPPPSTLDRLTAFVVLVPDRNTAPVVVARFTRPFDAAKMRAAYLPGAKAEAVGGKELFATVTGEAAYFPDDRTVAIGDAVALRAVLAAKPAAGGKLHAALTANAGRPFLAVANLKAIPLPPDAVAQAPPDFKPVLDAELAVVSLSLDAAPALSARLLYASADEATAADVALRKGLKRLQPLLDQARAQMRQALAGKAPAGKPRPLDELPLAAGGLVALGVLNTAEELLADPPLKRDGAALAADLQFQPGSGGAVGVAAVGVGLLLPAVQKVREAAARSQSTNNLKQIALALHNYESAHGHLPPAATTDPKTGQRLLSWRVAVLPYLEQKALYDKFKQDEPWDSPNNLPLSKVAIKVFQDPRGVGDDPSLTHYKAFVGGGAAWDWTVGRKITDFKDGTSNTLLVGAVGPPVPWSKPADVEFDPAAPLPELFTPPFNGLLAAFGDGSVRFVRPTIDPKTLKALLTAAGGEVIGDIP